MRTLLRILTLTLCVGTVFVTSCARSPQATRDKYLKTGKQFLDKKDYHRAVLEFQNAVQAMPLDAEARYELGLAMEQSGDAQRAFNNFKRAVEIDPKHQQAQLKLAEIKAATRDPQMVKEGQEELKKLADSSATPEVLNSLALTQLKLGETGDAVQSLQDALKISPRELSSSKMLALAMLAQKDPAGAEEVLKKACESAPNAPDPRIILGEFYQAQHRGPEAEAEFQKALAIDSKSYRALFDLARAEDAAGEKPQAEQNFKRLSSSGEKAYKDIHALFLFNNGRQPEAIAELEALTKQDPDDRLSRTRLVSAYVTAHRPADAEKILTQALQKNPHDLDALPQRAEVFQVSGRYADAEKDLNALLHLQPNSADAHYTLAKVHKAEGQPLSERQDLSEAVRLNPNHLPARVELAQLLSTAKNNPAALDTLDHAPAAQKQSVAWITERNWVLFASGDMAGFRDGIDKGLAKAKTADLLIQDGLWDLNAKKYPMAQTAVEQALIIAPADIRALQVLYISYQARKAAPAGLEKIKEYVARQPKSAPMQEFLGSLLLQTGDLSGARSAFDAAKAADAHFLAADFSLVQLDMREKKLDDARNRLKTILTADDRNLMAHLMLAAVEQMAGDQGSALDEYRKSIAIDARNTQALNNLAYLLADYANKPDEALAYAEKARELEPNNPHTADTLGWIYYRKGNYASAIQQMEAGASQNQSDAVIRYHLAMAYAKSGDGQKGLATWQAALKLNPNLPEARVAAGVLGAAK